MVFGLFRALLCGEGHTDILVSDSFNKTIPVFEECFHHVDLSWIPAIFILVFSPLVVHDLYISKREACTFYSPVTLRMVICFILCFTHMVSFVYHTVATFQSMANLVFLLGDAFQLFGTAVVTILTVACRNRGVTSSGTICCYWLLCVICGLPEFLSTLDGFGDNGLIGIMRKICFVIVFLLSFIELVLSSVADTVKEPWRGVQAKPCPETQSSFFSQITFSWFGKMASLGHAVPLERRHLWDLNDYDEGKVVFDNFNRFFKPEMDKFRYNRSKRPNMIVPQNVKPSIIWPIFRTHKWSFLCGAFMKLCFDLIQFVAPQLLAYLIAFIQDKEKPVWYGLSIAFSMFIFSSLQSVILHQYFHYMFRAGMNIRSALTQAVYRKLLVLSSASRRNMSAGQFINMITVDIQRFQDMTTFVMLFWSSPLQVVVATFFLYRLMGVAVFAGIAVLIILLPFNSFISVKMRNIQIDQMKYKDQRLKLTTQAMNGIKTIKMYAWEKVLEDMIVEIRNKEIAVLRKLAFLNAATTLSWACAPFLVAVLSFTVFVMIDPEKNVLTPQITFVALALFNILRFPLAVFSMIITQGIQWTVSNDRLTELFSSEEISPDAISHEDGKGYSIKMENASFYWNTKEEPQLSDISLNIKKGSLVAIVGRVGSGKSSLLSALLGEMNRSNGTTNVDGSIAYVPQQPWVMNMSARDNICLHLYEDEDYYDKIVRACALEADFGSMPQSDNTVIGDRGTSLSGGQKQRISLARAIYANSNIYLLDDPLSAVDAHVAKHIFRQVFSNKTGMLNRSTRVFATNQVQFLKHCDQIVFLKDGKIDEQGTYDELLALKGSFKELVEEFLAQESKSKARSVSFSENKMDELTPKPIHKTESEDSYSSSSSWSKSTIDSRSNTGDDSETSALLGPNPVQMKRNWKIDAEEPVETGQVSYDVHLAYLAAIGIPIAVSFVFVYICSSVLGVASNLWLARWTDDAKDIVAKNNGTYSGTTERLLIYATLGLGQAFAVCSASVIMALGMVRAGRVLHEKMLKKILRVPMMFFDMASSGKIMNRFSKDIDILDARLPQSVLTFTGAIVQAVMIIFVPVYATPPVVIALVPIFIFYILILRYYVSTSRQLKRLESASRGPINSILQDTIVGAPSIRIYNEEDKFAEECANRIDNNLMTYYPSIVANRWLAIRLEFVGNLIVLFSALFAIFYRHSDGLTAGLVGLSVSYALNITQTLNWAVRMTSELETNVVAVERIKEYTELQSEGVNPGGRRHFSQKATPNDWPHLGEINIRNLNVRYRPCGEYILKGLSVHIEAREKVGIVGRTGSGKTTFIQSLFRILEAEKGTIEIDGQNIAQFHVEEFRSRLTIVPQEPYLFSGSLKANLDPLGIIPDHEVWRALQSCHLDSFISALPGGLHYQISENGDNLSVGQRQLICLARALMRKSKVLILDEAAAAIDLETDNMIQKTIKREFRDCTVLTIAHRLSSVMDCDRVMVIQDGRVIEMDSPKILLANPESMFSTLAKAAGVGKNEPKPSSSRQ